ncbi:cysteine synthase family protein [Xenorhabdus budapestensis]|uniref:cysteine synthase n=1 Tax=Xenorhabdus budapestensis TaxID=290110 RepID=A0A2D0IQ43_XENBU|nr:cysteine synthase family protein [Xenorhabdus budapestensis]PHM23946.1 O-Acetyl serine sulfhydrylase [Xenorhabdus budapestensis]
MSFFKRNIIDNISETPLINLEKINKALGTNVVVKLEKNNPGGSIKDRAAVFIIEQAEKKGFLKPGGTVIESSSGNFAISLSMIGAAKGYRVIALVDPKATETNKALMKAYGAEVITVTEQDDTGSYHKTRIKLANELARKIPGSYRPDQCFNVLSAVAHYHTTAKEIHAQTGGLIAGIACAVSTGGQIGGIAEYFGKHLPETKVICVDAYGSSIFGGPSHAYKIPGVGLGWTPRNISDVSKIDFVYRAKDESAYIAARLLCRHEGILVGVSSGAVLLAALNASKRLRNIHPIVAVLGDSGERYLDTLFNDSWLESNNIDTGVEFERLLTLAESMEAPVEAGNIDSNYRDDLISLLEVPATTITHYNMLDK